MAQIVGYNYYILINWPHVMGDIFFFTGWQHVHKNHYYHISKNRTCKMNSYTYFFLRTT